MDLIIFIFKSRLRFYFKGEGAASRIIGLIGFTLLGLFYGFVMGYFLDNSYRENISFDSLDFIRGLNVFLFVSTLTRAYLPSYKPRQDFISRIYPLTQSRRFLIDLMVDFLYPYFFVFFLFITTIKITSNTYDVIFYLQSFVILFSSHIIRRIIQEIFEKRIKASIGGVLFIFAASAVSCYVLLQNSVLRLSHDIISLALTIAAFITLAISDYIISASVIEQKKASSGTLIQKGIFNTFSTSFIFRNKAARKSIMVAFILKLFIIVVDLLLMAHSNTHLFNNVYIVWVYVSPLILYSYIYSNTWGFYRNLWLTMDKCTANFKPLFIVQMKLMAIPFIIDFILASAYFLITGKDVAFGFLFYIISLIIIVALSVFSSLTSARYVEKPLSFRANSSVGYRFMAVFVIMSLIVVKYYPVAIWGVLIYIIGSFAMIRFSFDKYWRLKYELFDKLFKSGNAG